ncbi:carboxypeptidase regulatory-like domain-containing protein [Spirosoma soli]|uniref:Carboxypeptidase regulatory-like domain-containing protein n=1 Tax=Spirosoma soli TaxID=1770529 RepID=A0ABW5MC35_9BACT
MKYVPILLILLVSSIFLWGCEEDTFIEPTQIGSVRGQVLLNTDRQPVRKALVRLSPSGRITETDSTGNFRFDSVLAGKYTIQVTKEGFRAEVATVEADQSLIAVVTVLLVNDRAQNRPPTPASQPSPASGATQVSVRTTFRWKATDPGRDTLTYDVLLFREGSTTPTRSFTGLRQDSLVVENLAYNATYYWQVIVKDGVNTVNSDVWSFRTQPFPDFAYVFARRIEGRYQIFTATTDQDALQLTSSGSNWRPIVSPNRQEIAFISNAETDLHLYVMNRDGSNVRRVTTVPIAGLSATDLSFCWSPDGTQLLYPGNDKLYAIRTDGTGLRVVGQASAGQMFSGCDWTGVGNRIVARLTNGTQYDNKFVLLSPDGGTLNAVLSRPDGRLSNPVFSIDGRQLLFSYDISNFQNEQGRQLDARIFLLTISTSELVELSTLRVNNQNINVKPAGTNDIEPRFAPNGSRVIFTNTDNTGTGQRNMIILDVSGGNRAQVITSAEMPYWR